MKNLFKNLMLVAVAAMAFTACEQVIDDVNATNEKFTVNIVGEFADDTRSGFVGSETVGDKTLYKSAWDGSETVRFAIIPDTFADGDKATYVDVENESEGDRATFAPTFESNVGTIHAFSPKGVYSSTDASACKGGFTSTTITLKYENAYVVVPAEQTPLANSVDPAAHILAGKADFADNVNMTFNHVVAYGKMTIKDFDGTIDKVEVTASESLAGNSCKYFYNEGNLNNANVNTITLNADNVEGNVFWFGCAPADLSEGTLTVKVYSGEDTYTKELAIAGANFKFQQGRVSAFNVSFADAAKDEIVVDWVDNAYNLVKSAAHLEVGDKVVIVAAGFDVAMSTTQNNNNRAKADVTKDGDTVTFNNDVQILTLEEGTTEGTFAFNTGSGYLYAASSSSNQLKTQTTLDDNGSWAIAIDANGVATIKAQGTNSRNWLRYNSASNSLLFSCYGSGQADVCIYKLVGEYTPTVPAISYTVADVSVEYDATSGEAAVTATNGDGWAFSATTDATWVDNLVYADSKISFEVDANDTEESRGATVTVTATKTGYDDVTVDFTITQGAKPAEEPEQPGEGGEADLGASYSFDVTAKVWSSWGTGAKCGDYTWAPNKVSVNGSPAVGNKDGSGRGQQFGAANTNQIKSMTMTCSDYTGGIKSLDVKACAKSGNTVTVDVTVGGVAMNCDANSATISGSNSGSIKTFNFTSDTALSGEIVITYSIKTAGALYVSGFAINNNNN